MRLPSARTVYIYSMRQTAPLATTLRPTPMCRPAEGARHGVGHRAPLHEASTHEAFDDGWGTLEQAARGRARRAATRRSSRSSVKSILAGNDSPDIDFDLSINPYRGCEHGCIYCFARPTHSYLNLSPGLDFETRIIAKVNAAERLREALARAELRAADAQHRLGDRRLPAGRAPAAHHALGDRGAGRMPRIRFR